MFRAYRPPPEPKEDWIDALTGTALPLIGMAAGGMLGMAGGPLGALAGAQMGMGAGSLLSGGVSSLRHPGMTPAEGAANRAGGLNQMGHGYGQWLARKRYGNPDTAQNEEIPSWMRGLSIGGM